MRNYLIGFILVMGILMLLCVKQENFDETQLFIDKFESEIAGTNIRSGVNPLHKKLYIEDKRPPPNRFDISRQNGTPDVWQTNIEEDSPPPGNLDRVGTVLGCVPDNPGRILHPDQVACDKSNYQTAENFYRYYWNYPMVPNMDNDKWQPANYTDYNHAMAFDRSYRLIGQQISGGKEPYPSNYYFSYTQA